MLTALGRCSDGAEDAGLGLTLGGMPAGRLLRRGPILCCSGVGLLSASLQHGAWVCQTMSSAMQMLRSLDTCLTTSVQQHL
jgi:hypothetical protein